MTKQKYTLTSYDPVYVVAPEVRIPDEDIKAQAIRWLEANVCKDGEKAKYTDKFVREHCDDFKSTEELFMFIRYNMYKDNREGQQLADQDVICAELATRLVEELPESLVEECKFAARMRLEDMFHRNGITPDEYCAHNKIKKSKLYGDVEMRAVQSLREDAALEAYADYKNYTLDADDFYAIIPGKTIEEKAYKRRQIEADGRLAGMEEYARKTKALKEVMDNAMVKRDDDPNLEYVRYGDVSTEVVNAQQQYPEAFQTL